MTIIIAGDRSGVGKTTITLALLSFLARHSAKVQSFKVGPDYIDPMFHTQVTGRSCRNLDPILTSPDYVKHSFGYHSQGAKYSVIEGVMGLFDGVSLQNQRNYASTAHIAKILDVPVVLVLDCSRLSGSVGAIAQGYANFDPDVNIAGLVLNRVGSDRHLQLLKTALEPLNLPILGVFRRQDNIKLRDRHLGLVPTEEVASFPKIQEELATIAQESFNWEQLLPLLDAPQTSVSPLWENIPRQSSFRVGIARDRAFNFYYQDNLDLLEQLGGEVIPYSPLDDTALPPNLDLLYLPGGFPEVFAQELAQNKAIVKEIKTAIQGGLTTYAECGGLMYLCQSITNFEGETWEMLGLLPTHVMMGKRLTLGYRKATPLAANPILEQNQTIWGHEFHRSQLQENSSSPLYQLCDLHQNKTPDGWKMKSIYASYLHLHWGEFPNFPLGLIKLNG
ncbi:MAG: cobyrinate a,c-diamide synthase [Halothece sp.]